MHLFLPRLSRLRRAEALDLIARERNRALYLITNLMRILRAENPAAIPEVQTLFTKVAIEIRCVETLALVAAASARRGNVNVPSERFREIMERLVEVRVSETFAGLTPSVRLDVWLCIASVAGVLGDEPTRRLAVQECLELSATDEDVDSQIQMLMNAFGAADSDEERLVLVRRLNAIGSNPLIGPVFSRERLGRLSTMHDVFSQMAAGAEADTPEGLDLVNESYRGRHRWLYDMEPPTDPRIIRVVANWQGNARITWRIPTGQTVVRSFSLRPDLAAKLVSSTESASTSNRPIIAAINALSANLGSLATEALVDIPEARLDVAGFLGLLPVMATRVGSSPIGSSPLASYLHPLTGSLAPADHPAPPPDLLIIDRRFAALSREVETAFYRFHAALGTTAATVLALDSGPTGYDLEPECVLDRLVAAQGAVFYGHSRNVMAQVGATALVLGPARGLGVERIYQANLRNLQTMMLVCCSSGRQNPFLGPVSLAHAMALAGTRDLVFSLWPITAARGARFATSAMAQLASGRTQGEYLADLYRSDVVQAAPFGAIRA